MDTDSIRRGLITGLLTNLIVIALLVAASVARADDTERSRLRVRMVEPLSVSKLADLDFGAMSVGSAGGTAVVNPRSQARTVSGDVIEEGGNVSAAAFEVSGQNRLRYDIILPSSLTLHSGSSSMVVDSFTTNKRGNRGRLRGGRDTFRVGATLNVAGNQASGTYVGVFDVTVAYQ